MRTISQFSYTAPTSRQVQFSGLFRKAQPEVHLLGASPKTHKGRGILRNVMMVLTAAGTLLGASVATPKSAEACNCKPNEHIEKNEKGKQYCVPNTKPKPKPPTPKPKPPVVDPPGNVVITPPPPPPTPVHVVSENRVKDTTSQRVDRMRLLTAPTQIPANSTNGNFSINGEANDNGFYGVNAGLTGNHTFAADNETALVGSFGAEATVSNYGPLGRVGGDVSVLHKLSDAITARFSGGGETGFTPVDRFKRKTTTAGYSDGRSERTSRTSSEKGNSPYADARVETGVDIKLKDGVSFGPTVGIGLPLTGGNLGKVIPYAEVRLDGDLGKRKPGGRGWSVGGNFGSQNLINGDVGGKADITYNW